MNVFVGDNDAGKSTILEAIGMALTGRINGRWIEDQLDPYWFNLDLVGQYFAEYKQDRRRPPPEILIEVYLTSQPDELQPLRGLHNSRGEDVPGLKVRIRPAPEYLDELDAYMCSQHSDKLLPVEYYMVEWLDFANNVHQRRPREIRVSAINSRTGRASSGIDYFTRETLAEQIAPADRARVAVADRLARRGAARNALDPVNQGLAKQRGRIHSKRISLQLDESARAAWESGIVPAVNDIPFSCAGQGQQVAIKVALAMLRSKDHSGVVLVEEPENHLSHTGLTRLIGRIDELAGDRQVFITTHSSFVLNRLGLDRLHLLHCGTVTGFGALSAETVKYFQRLSGYDTLRLVLAKKVVLVEGPSDEMVFSRAYRDRYGHDPISNGIDVIAMNGLAFARSLELCAALKRKAVVLRDNDGKPPENWQENLKPHLAAGVRELFVSDPESGPTLEPQLRACNDEALLRTVLEVGATRSLDAWMETNKTLGALRIAQAEQSIAYPTYILKAMEFLE